MSLTNENLTPEDYLKSLFVFSPSEDSPDSTDLESFLYQKLTRKRFRKQKLHSDTEKEFKEKIAAKLKKNEPLYFTIPFGGYKHLWNASHPEPDWAEIFTLRFLAEWLMPVATNYKPGAIVDFISEDLILTRMNNYPESALEKYSEVFSSLIESFSSCLPENLKFTFFRVGDRYSSRAIIDEVEKLLPERWKSWEKYTGEEKAIELKRSKRSVMWLGKEDLTKLTPDEKYKRTIESRLIELAYYDVEAYPEFLGDYFVEDNRINICFSFGLSADNIFHAITLGSTYASVVDFWIGRGVLEKSKGKFIPKILSKQQYEEIKNNLIEIPVDFPHLPKNFQSIDIMSEGI